MALQYIALLPRVYKTPHLPRIQLYTCCEVLDGLLVLFAGKGSVAGVLLCSCPGLAELRWTSREQTHVKPVSPFITQR